MDSIERWNNIRDMIEVMKQQAELSKEVRDILENYTPENIADRFIVYSILNL